MAGGEKEDSDKEEFFLPSFLPQERSLSMSCALTLCMCPLLKLDLKLSMLKDGIGKEKEVENREEVEEAAACRGKKRKQLEDPSVELDNSKEDQKADSEYQRTLI